MLPAGASATTWPLTGSSQSVAEFLAAAGAATTSTLVGAGYIPVSGPSRDRVYVLADEYGMLVLADYGMTVPADEHTMSVAASAGSSSP